MGWSAVASRGLARPLVYAQGVRVVAVGGSTLGGSGKTPLAIACARELAKGGAGRVVYVAHGYRAKPGSPRIVQVDDDLACVGDEALVAARALEGSVAVVVAGTRQAALDYASARADVIVVDGVLQTAPRRASLALLALDAFSPWGTGYAPPRGDLRAPASDLLAAVDRAVLLRDELSTPAVPRLAGGRGVDIAEVVAHGARFGDRRLAWPELAAMRVGLFVALARPSRIVASLARRAVAPAVVIESSDHAPVSSWSLSRRLASVPVDLWLATAKCATHLEGADIPHATLDHDVFLDESLVRALRASTA